MAFEITPQPMDSDLRLHTGIVKVITISAFHAEMLISFSLSMTFRSG